MKVTKLPIKLVFEVNDTKELKTKWLTYLTLKKQARLLSPKDAELAYFKNEIKTFRKEHKEFVFGNYGLSITNGKQNLTMIFDKIPRGEENKEFVEEWTSSIKEFRTKRREIKPEEKNVLGFNFQTFGGVFKNKESIIEIQTQNQMTRLDQAKKPHPTSKVKYVGIELELFSNYKDDDFKRELIKAKLAGYVNLKGDGSIKPDLPDQRGREVTVMCDQKDVDHIIQRLCYVLKKGNAAVNNSCGYHIHVDCRNRNPSVVYNNLVKALPILSGMVPPIRVKGSEASSYCKQNNQDDSFEISSKSGDRYKAVNPEAYAKYKTIEVRMHSGTTNRKKIVMWSKIITTIADAPEIKQTIKSLNDIKDIINDEEVFTYMKERTDLFNKTGSTVDTKVDHAFDMMQEGA